MNAGWHSAFASRLAPTIEWGYGERLVGCQAAIAGKPAPTFGLGASARDWLAVRASSLASQLLQLKWVHLLEIGQSGRLRGQASLLQNQMQSGVQLLLFTTQGRALARLQLLILIHPPLRKAECRCSSGGRRAAPFDAVEHIERRSSRSRPEAMRPDEYRSEGTPSLSEGPDAGARLFGSFCGV
ncbi:hypothetical protein AEQ67_32950 [Pseudomonas sp. RIT-PI-q]|nr:hypothetical protein AEQ67_32950 [Pseudomonas sp. RIT-PI-q]